MFEIRARLYCEWENEIMYYFTYRKIEMWFFIQSYAHYHVYCVASPLFLNRFENFIEILVINDVL